MTTSKKTFGVIALAAGAALALSGCGAGQISQTAVQHPAINGNNVNVGSIALRDVRVLYPDGSDFTNLAGGKAVLAFAAVNDSPDVEDTLQDITVPIGSVEIAPDAPKVPAGRTLVAAGPAGDHAEATSGDPDVKPILVELTNLSEDVRPGLTVPVTFVFSKSGKITVQVPVDAGHDEERHSSEKSGLAEEAPAEGGTGGGH